MKRQQDGREYPVLDTSFVDCQGDRSYLICSPDSFGLDGTGDAVRFTLLRAPAFAWQGKKGSIDPTEYQRWTDRGEHRFRFALSPSKDGSEAWCVADSMHEVPMVFDWTVGMEAERNQLRGGHSGWHASADSGEYSHG